MRTGFSWLQRQSLCRCTRLDRVSRCGHSTLVRRRRDVQLVTNVYVSQHCLHSSARQLRGDIYSTGPTPFVSSLGNGISNNTAIPPKSRTTRVPRVPTDRLKDTLAWWELLDPYLPPSLRTEPSKGKSLAQSRVEDEEDVCQAIIAILDAARREQHAGIELLTYMIIHGRRHAALHIVDRLLQDLAARYPARSQNRMPSNIRWPGQTMNDVCGRPIELSQSVLQVPQLQTDLDGEVEDPRYSFIASEKKESTMIEMWSMLGALFAQAAELPEAQAADANNAALLVLGQIHNLDLVPQSVYDFRHGPLTTTVQKPPILQLVSSRILAAISDATWRQQQDNLIEKAASHGISYEAIGRDPPGGRFRLKVRPLGPEIWLEFILWCCVEGGFPNAGSRIIRSLQNQVDNPWFAVTWSTSSGRSQTSPVVDWERVRARYGGSVGLKEGYSGDKPFVEMPSRTLSTEVVLGLVDASVNSINRVTSRESGALTVQRNILELITFLEPHDMPPSYFNYLAVRLMQTDVFGLPDYAHTLQAWYKRLASMKALTPAKPFQTLQPALNLTSISAYSEVFAGVLHQALDGCVQSRDIHRALDIFNSLQELVDTSKLQAIGSFLGDPTSNKGIAVPTTSQPTTGILTEFVSSHGQLPLYKLTGLLDLATDTGLTGFVRWLLHSDDPDGPIIPVTAYQDPSLTQALLRFASANQDTDLLRAILRAHKSSRRLFSVNLLRTVINTNIALLQFEQAHSKLDRLSLAKGGGLGLTNIAQLAAVIIKLESGNHYEVTDFEKARHLQNGQQLLEQMLDGDFDDRTGTFQSIIRRNFRQQIGAMLQVFQTDPSSLLSEVGANYSDKFPVANKAALTSTIFNYLMEAVVQCKGSTEGLQLWKLCCQSTQEPEQRAFDFWQTDDGLVHDEIAQPSTRSEETFERDQSIPFSDKNEYGHKHEISYEASDESGMTSSSERGALPTNLDVLESAIFENKFFPSTNVAVSSPSKPTYRCVIPTQQTLRLIIRGAVRERQEALRLGKSIALQKSVLAWAAEELEGFGATPRMISMEIEEPLKQSKIRKLDGTRYESRLRKSESSDIVRRVSSSFTGQNQTRPLSRKQAVRSGG